MRSQIQTESRGRSWQLLVATVGVSLVGLSLAACSPAAPVASSPAVETAMSDALPSGAATTAAGPASLMDASPEVKSVLASGSTIEVVVQLDSAAFKPKDHIDDLELLTEAIGKAIKAGVREDSPTIKSVVLTTSVEGVDRLGNKGRLPLVKVTFSADDLRRAKYENLYGSGSFDLATEVHPLSAAGVAALSEWCADGDNASLSPHICRVRS